MAVANVVQGPVEHKGLHQVRDAVRRSAFVVILKPLTLKLLR